MKAIRIHQFGPSEDVLQYEDVPVPEPKAGEVLVKVEAASLNRADLSLRKGAYRISPDQLPVIPGREFAGTVAKLGADVTIDTSENDFLPDVILSDERRVGKDIG